MFQKMGSKTFFFQKLCTSANIDTVCSKNKHPEIIFDKEKKFRPTSTEKLQMTS